MNVVLSWTATTDKTVTGYNIYRSETTGGPYDLIGKTAQADFTDIPPQQNWYYVVTAFNLDGESAFSNEYLATAPVLPAAPTSLTATVT